MGIDRDGNCPGWELSGMGNVRWELSGMGTVRDGNCPGTVIECIELFSVFLLYDLGERP